VYVRIVVLERVKSLKLVDRDTLHTEVGRISSAVDELFHALSVCVDNESF
jgi:hypothetical protein